MGKNGYLNLTEFAKLIGVTRQAVSYAVKKGRLKTKLVGRIHMLHAATAKKQWETSIDKTASKKGKKNTGKKGPKPRDYEPAKYEGLTTADAERQEKVYKARLSQLKYLEQAGKLVEVEKIQREAFETARKVRDAIMAIPPRISHELAVETDPHRLEIKLTRELTDSLDRLIGAKK